MVTELATADAASPWVRHLERAHGLAHAVARTIEEEPGPCAHLAPAARQLERGVTAMYDAFDGRADRVTAIGRAHARLWDAAVLVARAGFPSALATLRDACGELLAAEERFPRVALAARGGVALRASTELPPLHVIERASLAPAFRAPPEPAVVEAVEAGTEVEAAAGRPVPTTFEELAVAAQAVRRLAQERTKALTQGPAPRKRKEKEAVPAPEEPPPGFAFVPPARIAGDDFVRRWARECFEEIGMLGLQRAPMLGDDWRACQVLEQRLVIALDALAALGPVAIAYIEPLVMDAPAAHPMRVFAAAMIGGSLEGRDALAFAERALHRFGPGDPFVAEAFASAMKLASNPFVPNVLRELLVSTDRACRAIAVDVLAYRGWLTPMELDVLADEEEDPRVLALVLRALAGARHPALARGLARGVGHADLRVQEAALDAMALAGHRDAASVARAAAEGALGERALVRLAIVGDEEDARWLLERLRGAVAAGATSVEGVEAVGWAGLVDAVPVLIGLLGTGGAGSAGRAEAEHEDEVKLAAGAALERLLGAQMMDSVEVLPEALDGEEVQLPEQGLDQKPLLAGRSLEELVSDARDRPAAGSAEKVEVPSIDPQKWGAYWGEYGWRSDLKKRIRRGQAYSPSVSLYELDRLMLTAEDRRRLHRELAARTGRITPFDPHDFVVVQGTSLKAWEAIVREMPAAASGWARPAAR